MFEKFETCWVKENARLLVHDLSLIPYPSIVSFKSISSLSQQWETNSMTFPRS